MDITAIADLHGHYPKLPGGDLLIIAGDMTKNDTVENWLEFYGWMENQLYDKIVYIGGNHDNLLQKEQYDSSAVYLEDSGITYKGLKIWGSPWSLRFDGINPKCCAFTKHSDNTLAKKWDLIPDDIDILITHIPPYGILDNIFDGGHVGSHSLRRNVLSANRFTNLKVHIFGHIHEGGGQILPSPLCKFINASHVNEMYEPVNPAIRIEI